MENKQNQVILTAMPVEKVGSSSQVFVKLISYALFALGILVLLGWLLNLRVLTSIIHGATPMNPMSAVNFLVTAVCLYLINHRKGKTLVVVLATYLVIFGFFMLSKYFYGVDIGVDRLLFTAKLGINRMAPLTALNFLLIGISFLIIDWRIKKFTPYQVLALITMGSGLYSLAAYLYGFIGIYGISAINPVAIHTATAFFCIGIAFIAVRPETGIGHFIYWLLTDDAQIGKRVDAIFLCGLATVIIIGIFSYTSLTHYIGYFKELQRHTQEQDSRQDLITTLMTAESNQRGYLLTGNKTLLQQFYYPSERQYPSYIATMRVISTDSNEQNETTQLQNLLEKKFAEMDQTIYLKQNVSAAAAVALVESGTGQLYTDKIKELIANEQAGDDQRSTETSDKLNESGHNSLTTIVVGSIFSVLVTLLAMIFINRELRQKRITQELLKAQKNSLDEKLIELEKANRFMVDRELKMAELKVEIKKLKGQA